MANKAVVLWLVLVAGMLLFPPYVSVVNWKGVHERTPIGYGCLLCPPSNPEGESLLIDHSRLLIQIAFAGAITGILYIAGRSGFLPSETTWRRVFRTTGNGILVLILTFAVWLVGALLIGAAADLGVVRWDTDPTLRAPADRAARSLYGVPITEAEYIQIKDFSARYKTERLSGSPMTHQEANFLVTYFQVNKRFPAYSDLAAIRAKIIAWLEAWKAVRLLLIGLVWPATALWFGLKYAKVVTTPPPLTELSSRR